MFSLDSRSREPIYVQLEKAVVNPDPIFDFFIHLGVFEADSPLPSVRALATQLSINPNTVSKAYKNLEQHGVIYTVAGKGVFVNKTDLSAIRIEAEKALKTAVKDAKNAGMEKEEIISIIDSVWEGKA